MNSLVHSADCIGSIPGGDVAPLRLTPDQIEAGKTEAGGFTKETLAGWGVGWPPPKGWKERLIAGDVFEPYVPEPVTMAEEAWSRALCAAADDEPDRIVGCPELPLWRSYLSFARLAMKARTALESPSVGTKPEGRSAPNQPGETSRG